MLNNTLALTSEPSLNRDWEKNENNEFCNQVLFLNHLIFFLFVFVFVKLK